MELDHNKNFNEFISLLENVYKERRTPDYQEKINKSTLAINSDEYNKPYNGITGETINNEVANKLVYAHFNSNCWIDLEKAKENNLSLKAGEKILNVKHDDKELFFINFEQLSDLSKEKINLKPDNPNSIKNWNNISEIDKYINKQNVNIYKNSFDTGFATVGTTDIHLLPDDQITSDKQYYRIVFHELAHTTAKELGRENPLSSELSYSKEELIAEFASYRLCKSFGVEDKLGAGCYLESYLNKARDEYKAIDKNFDVANLIESTIKESNRAIELIEKRGRGIDINQSSSVDLNDISNFLKSPNDRSNLLKLSENMAKNPDEFNKQLVNYVNQLTQNNSTFKLPEKLDNYFKNKTPDEKLKEFPQIIKESINKITVDVLRNARMNNDNSKEVQALKSNYITISNASFKTNKETGVKALEERKETGKSKESNLTLNR